MRNIIAIILVTTALNISAQQKYQVVTKLVEQEYAYSGQLLRINAEKANIEIKVWDKQKVGLKLKLKSKHPKLEEAKKASSYLKYLVNERKKELFIKNYILISNGEELTAKLQAEYELFVPQNCKLNISNSLGNIEINDFEGELKINQNLGDVTIAESSGSLHAFIEIGDFTCRNSNFNAVINAEYAEMILKGVLGKYEISTKMGNFTIQPQKELQLLELTSENTAVTFINSNCHNFNLFLKADHGEIKGLSQCNYSPISVVKNTSQGKGSIKEFVYLKKKDNTKISIATKYADIKLF